MLALALPFSSCSKNSDEDEERQDLDTGDAPDKDSGGSTDKNPDEECVDNDAFFQEKVWRPVLQTQCKNCHNSSGVAKDSKLVLVGSEWGPTYVEHNHDVLKSVAINQQKGTSILLLKPAGDAEHGGGEVLAADSGEMAALQEFVERLDNPVTCANNSQQVESTYAGMDLLSPAQTFRKAALSLAGRLPTAKELEQLEGDGTQELDELLDKLMHEEAFYDRLVVLFNDEFLTDEYLGTNDALVLLDTDDYPETRWFDSIEDNGQRSVMSGYTNRAVAREPLELIKYIVRNHRSFEEILTANYTVVNPFSARVYGANARFANPMDPNEWVAAKIPGIPHAGIMTSNMFMNRFPTTPTNRNRHRAKMLYRFFLATDLEALASRPLDPTQIADHNPTLNTPACTVCHSNMDPVAGALQNWDDRGRYRPPEEGWYPEMASPGFGDKRMPSSQVTKGAQWLAQEIVKDRRFAFSIVHMVHKMLTGHEALKEPQDPSDRNYENDKLAFEAQSKAFGKIATEFAENGFELRDIFRAMILSPSYRAKINTPLTPTQEKIFASMENTRLLTPEQLNVKIEAVLGYPWRPRFEDPDYLMSSRWFSIFYGGIDSVNVVARITEPNGIMANVIERMASEMACWSVARDFSLAKEDRILFPKVETSFVPKDENDFTVPHAQAAIRENLVYLHKRFFDVSLDTTDPEIERAYKLYEDVWADGLAKIKDKSVAVALPPSCRSTSDFWTRKPLEEEAQITNDNVYTIRAWTAIVQYLLTDYRFVHE